MKTLSHSLFLSRTDIFFTFYFIVNEYEMSLILITATCHWQNTDICPPTVAGTVYMFWTCRQLKCAWSFSIYYTRVLMLFDCQHVQNDHLNCSTVSLWASLNLSQSGNNSVSWSVSSETSFLLFITSLLVYHPPNTEVIQSALHKAKKCIRTMFKTVQRKVLECLQFSSSNYQTLLHS